MTLFRGRGIALGTILSALLFVALLGFIHGGLAFGFRKLLLPEAQLPFAFLLVVSFGFIATYRLAGAVRLVNARRRRWVGVDEAGLEWTDGERTVRMAWADVEEVRVHFVRLHTHVVSYVTVLNRSGERVALSHLFQGRIQEKTNGVRTDHAVVDVEMTPFVLWLLKERAGLSEVEPFVWRRGEPSVVVVEEPSADPEMARRVGNPLASLSSPLQIALVLGTLLLYAQYSSWLAATLFVVLLFLHELGHVFAMVRLGMKVRGVYFVPPLGAVTVPETLWKDRDALAYTSLSGPLWGVLGSMPVLAAWYLTGQQHGDLPKVVLLNALLNLLNLLPIAPLDGARVMASILSSVSPRLGVLVGFGVILVTLGAALATGVFPPWVLAILGLIFGVFGGSEVLSQYSAAVEAQKVRSVVPLGTEGAEEVSRFGDMLALQSVQEYAWTRAGGAPRRIGRWMRWQQVVGCKPMGGGRIAFYLTFYLLLVATLIIGLVASVPLVRELGRP